MQGGEFIINGNVGDFLGDDLRSGMIVVNGQAGDFIGSSRSGGEIHLNGDYESITRECDGGNIYHKGKMIIKNGKPVRGAKIKWALEI